MQTGEPYAFRITGFMFKYLNLFDLFFQTDKNRQTTEVTFVSCFPSPCLSLGAGPFFFCVLKRRNKKRAPRCSGPSGSLPLLDQDGTWPNSLRSDNAHV